MPATTGKKLSVIDLNARRLQAVELRIAGLTLKLISAATCLTAPTIISAHKSWLSGGWAAVPVKERGRKQGEGRALSGEQEKEIYRLIISTKPDEHELTSLLWQIEAVQALVKRLYALTLSERTTAHYLQRWNLAALKPTLRIAASSTSVQRWYKTTYRDLQHHSRSENGEIHWIDDTSVPCEKGGLKIGTLQSVTNRGKVFWLPYDGSLRAPHLVDFFDRLTRESGRKIFAMLAGMQWQRAATFSSWASERTSQIRLFHLPLAAEMPNGAQRIFTKIRDEERKPVIDRKSYDEPPEARASPENPMLAMVQQILKHQITRSSEDQSRYSRKPERKRKDNPMNLSHLQRLEAESIHAMREVVAEADNPVMLYSVGKDSAVMLHLAMKAFYPAKPPFALLHVDTTWKFREMYSFRDQMVAKLGIELLTYTNPEGLEMGISPFKHGSEIHTNIMKTEGLKQALDHYGFDAAFGGARRDEEKSRAKERIFSFRSAQHRWDPKSQRPELWHLYNTRKHKGESLRVFPLSNWTELDIWQYIHLENIPIVPLYFAAPRPVVERNGMLLMVDDDRMPLNEGEVPMMRNVRFRTLGCYPLTGAIESEANTLPLIIQEMLLARTSERQGRMIDHDSSASMEKKKQEGYF